MADNLNRISQAPVRLALIGLICFFSLWGCAATTGNGAYHTVKRGETLWRISRNYGVDVKDLAEANNIKTPSDLEVGKRILIPGASGAKPSHKYAHNGKKTAVAPVSVEREYGRVNISREKFLWPVRGDLSSRFGMRDGLRHDGIDILASEGTPVKAADEGQVAYISSEMRGYGNIIILRHKDGFFTVYAHNKQNLVNSGDRVGKGDTIAVVGATGNAVTAHLHFEVRYGRTTLDPLFYLP